MDNVKVMNDELRNIRYMKDIKDELHQTNIFLGHLCKVMDALLLESDNTMRDANVRVEYDPHIDTSHMGGIGIITNDTAQLVNGSN